MSATVIRPDGPALKKYEVVNTLAHKYDYRRFLEISTPTTGFTFGNVAAGGFDVCHRYIYNCPDYLDDGQAVTFRSAEKTSADMLRALARLGAPNRPYDCIFIDPHHTYCSTAIDMAGAFAMLEDGGAIVVHDCNPTDSKLAAATFRKGAWCGLTFAAFIDFALRRAVAYYTVDSDHGCGVILKRPAATLDKAARLGRDQLAFEWEVLRDDEDARFRLFERNRKALLNLISAKEFLEQEAAAPQAPDQVSDALAVRPARALSSPRTASGTRWWQSRLVVRHVNRMICGKAIDGAGGGDVERLQSLSADKPFTRALSVSVGNVQNEIRLLQAGVVTELDLFETSERRAAGARQRAVNAGVGTRLHIHVGNPLAEPAKPGYQLVYWNNSLQHRPDTTAAVEWSRAALERGGVFYMNEYIGRNRRQYTDRQLDLAEHARATLSENYLRSPDPMGGRLAARPPRPDPAALQRTDPDDCADTEAILQAVRAAFPQAVVTPIGGVIYLIALSDVLANMDDVQDEAVLRAMLLADELCIEVGESLYATAHARVA